MNLNIILGWSIAALAMAGLIVYTSLRNKNREKKSLEPLLSFAKENNSEISYYDTWEKTLIGIDNKEINSLFFIRNIPDREIREKIILSKVSECSMFKTERKVTYDKKTVNVIDRIELIFSFYNHTPELSLEFYNTDYDQLTISVELQLAQKWMGMIKSKIIDYRDLRAKELEHQKVSPISSRPVLNENTYYKPKKAKKAMEKAHSV